MNIYLYHTIYICILYEYMSSDQQCSYHLVTSCLKVAIGNQKIIELLYKW